MLQLAADNPMEGHRPNTGATKAAKWGVGLEGLSKATHAVPSLKKRSALRWRVRQQMLGVRPSASPEEAPRSVRVAWD